MSHIRQKKLTLVTTIFLILGILLCPFDNVKADTQTVRVGFFPLHGFYECDASGKLFGYGVEYMNSIANQAGWDVDYVKADSWVEALQMLRDGKIDILAPSERTTEREADFSFSPFPIGTEYGSIVALNSNQKLVYEDFKSMNGIKVGCVKSIVFMENFLKYESIHNFQTNLVYYKDTAALVEALKAGEVDAIMVNLMVKTDTMKLLGRFGASPFYYMVNKNRSDLLQELNRALQDFNTAHPSYQNDLSQKYFSDFVMTPFTKNEENFIKNMGTINVGLTSNFAPVSHADAKTGEICGIDKRILEKIAKISGLKFSYQLLPEKTVTYDYLVKNKIQLVGEVENNSINSTLKGLQLTNSYLSISKVFVGKSGQLYNLKSKLKMAVASASASLQAVLKKDYPNYEVVCYETTEECLKAVEKGEADVVLQNRYVIEPYLSNPHYDNLTILPIDGVEAPYSFSLISRELTEEQQALLISILNKSIEQITDATLSDIISTEVVDSQYQYTWKDFVYQYRHPLWVGAVILLLMLLVLGYALRLRHLSHRKIEESEKKLSSITNNINGGVVVLKADKGLEITFANDGFLALLGCNRSDLENQYANSYVAFVHEDDLPILEKLMADPSKLDERISVNLRIRRKDDIYICTLFNGTVSQNISGEYEMYCVIMDVTEQVELIEQLNLAKRRSDLIIDKSENVIFEVDMHSKEMTVSHNLKDKLGWTFPKKLMNADEEEMLHIWKVKEEDQEKLVEATRKLIDDKKDSFCVIRLLRHEVESIWCQVNQYPIYSESGELMSIVGNIIDVDDDMQEKEKLEKMAQMDTLTGLLKKEAFANMAMAYLNQQKHCDSAFLFIDLDHFKQVNDTLGHMVGDKAIIAAAQKLQVIFSHYDILGRFGGDEFCVLVKDIPQKTLTKKLGWILEKMCSTYGEGENTVSVTCSIGVATTEKIGMQYSQLIEKADQALYAAKEKGRNRYEFA